MNPHPLATLGDAIYWAQSHWTVRELPLRLHSGGVEPESQLGAPRAAAAFMRYLIAEPGDRSPVTVKEPCGHPRIARDRHGEIAEPLIRCGDCAGTGTQTKTAWRYRWPMWRALQALKHAKADKPGDPAPIILIAALVLNAWEPRHAASMLDMDEHTARPLLFDALRKLWSRYEEGPTGDTRPSWVDMSDANRHAIEAGEHAAA